MNVEFVILLGGIGIDECSIVAERARAAVESKDFFIPGQDEPLTQTISVGVAELTSDDDVEKLIMRVDKALYKAKDAGRNKVIVAS